MKKLGKIFFTILIFGLFIVFPVAAQKTKSDFQKMYMDFLKKKGYNPSILESGDITFVIYGNGYTIIVNETAPQQFNMYAYYPLRSIPRQTLLTAVNKTNFNTYGAKILISDNNDFAFIVVENLLPKPKDFQVVFDRVISIILDAVYFLIDELPK